MKKLFLCAAVAVFAFSSMNAQEEGKTYGFSQGNIYASGSLNFNSSKTGDFKDNSFNFIPCVGFFVSDNVAVGAQLGIGSSKSENGSSTISEFSTFAVGAYAKYYFTPAEQFSFFGRFGVNYESAKNKISDVKADGFAFELNPGLNYFLSECIAIHATFGALGYSSFKQDTPGAESTNNFGLNLDLKDIGFGVIVVF
ncbi:hypothetical protein GCM10023311_01430 [Flaviramulus aquimarinus]|uniref:Outer membrane protein beta-barrel domain-containing protein n=1 Tax=Flaviramulus aquimarinus TaxID=1170456 RepID=A0ABP9EMT2_9FLAO